MIRRVDDLSLKFLVFTGCLIRPKILIYIFDYFVSFMYFWLGWYDLSFLDCVLLEFCDLINLHIYYNLVIDYIPSPLSFTLLNSACSYSGSWFTLLFAVLLFAFLMEDSFLAFSFSVEINSDNLSDAFPRPEEFFLCREEGTLD
jgi:hypothetical protein